MPVPIGRSMSARGGPSQVSYQQQQVGTLIAATARVVEDAILIELQVEKSQVERRTEPTEPENEFVPVGTETLTLHLSLRVESGKTVVAGGLEQSVNADSAAQLVLASARRSWSRREPYETLRRLSPRIRGRYEFSRSSMRRPRMRQRLLRQSLRTICTP